MVNLSNKVQIVVLVIVALLVSSGCCAKKQAPPAGAGPSGVTQAPVVTQEPGAGIQEESLEDQARKAGALHPIYFDFDKYNLKPEATQKLDQTGDWLSKNAGVAIRVEGHCDERGTNEYNIALGERRANSAKKYLVDLGVAADRLSTVSYGEEQPADSGHTEEAWAKNRRDEFKVAE
jgi:peptidoglycan-associated lipoprotein